jgi:hypothetical protein
LFHIAIYLDISITTSIINWTGPFGSLKLEFSEGLYPIMRELLGRGNGIEKSLEMLGEGEGEAMGEGKTYGKYKNQEKVYMGSMKKSQWKISRKA